MFLQRTHVRNMLAAVATGVETEKFAMLWLMAYVFLLRAPSEALPIEKGGPSEALSNGQAVFYLEVYVFPTQSECRLRLAVLPGRANR